MVKRTMENCGIKKRVGDPGKDGNGKCMGFSRSRSDDEPCDACRKCKYCTSYEEEQDEEKPEDLNGTKKNRTLAIIQKEYEKAEAAARAACKRSNELEQEITDYKIEHGMYHQMSELMQYQGEDICSITLVAVGKDGKLFAKQFIGEMYLTVDQLGHLDGTSEYSSLTYEPESDTYIYAENHRTTSYRFIGYLDIDFF